MLSQLNATSMELVDQEFIHIIFTFLNVKNILQTTAPKMYYIMSGQIRYGAFSCIVCRNPVFVVSVFFKS